MHVRTNGYRVVFRQLHRVVSSCVGEIVAELRAYMQWKQRLRYGGNDFMANRSPCERAIHTCRHEHKQHRHGGPMHVCSKTTHRT